MSAETIASPPPPAPPKVSVQEYLDRERQSDVRHEYVNGEIIAMSGESLEHNIIAGNILVEFRTAFRDRPCNAYMENVRVRVSPTQYRYPDVVALCGDAVLDGENPPAILNPTVLVEVLSPSTQQLDRNGKFNEYREMPSLTDYVLVEQDRISVLHYVRQSERQWAITEYIHLTDTLTFAALEVSFTLADVYRKINFAAQAAE